VQRVLARDYPQATCALTFASPLQLLVATILSAQCTDERVNKITPPLFARYSTARDFADADPEELMRMIHSCGFYRAKAKSIIGASRMIVARFGGEVPRSMAAMLELPGVARKTANVVLGTAYGVNAGIVVDTHVIRVSGRLGLTTEKNPVRIERDLMAVVPQEEWTVFAHRMTLHGRQVCQARAPRCPECAMRAFCRYARAKGGG
jgi:endonuclease-3